MTEQDLSLRIGRETPERVLAVGDALVAEWGPALLKLGRRALTDHDAPCLAELADLLIGEIEDMSKEMDRRQRVFWRHFRSQRDRADKAEAGLRALAVAVWRARKIATHNHDIAVHAKETAIKALEQGESLTLAIDLTTDALAFYADLANYDRPPRNIAGTGGNYPSDIDGDQGRRARDALAKVRDHFVDANEMVGEEEQNQ